ncbi:hypothetical protein B4077_3161 [Bacillus cereus]|uniref:Uncharacterized protein n=1 Tax=Bacillus cereus TaxID=1396 RepID=A0A0G8EDP1_BACCE|nr:hypothetical protein B4077_3161 [Bacillus cereus]
MDRIDVLTKSFIATFGGFCGYFFGRIGCNIENLSDDGSY